MKEPIIYMDSMPLRKGHFRVLAVASMGQLLGAGLATLIGIVIPMIQLVRHPELSSLMQGVLGSISLVGITIGSLIFGRLSDKYGYLFFFRLCPVIIFCASLLAFFVPKLPVLIISLFLMGFGIGGGYSLDSDYISEIMPNKWKLIMVGVAKASSAIGNILVAAICYLFLTLYYDARLWNYLFLIISIFSLLMILSRIKFAQSPYWLIAHHQEKKAEAAVRYFLGPDVEVLEQKNDNSTVNHIGSHIETSEIRNRTLNSAQKKISFSDLFRGVNLRRATLCGIPWACEGLGVYGIGVFLPILIMALGLDPSNNLLKNLTGPERAIEQIRTSVEITTWINFFILPGFIIGLILVKKVYHVKLQTWGFILCAIGLILLLIYYKFHLATWVAITGFIIFEFFLNAGPHLMTCILPSEIYPVADRGEGAGLAAATGKIGAVLGVLLIPVLLSKGGIELVLIVSVVVQLTGAIITEVFGRKVLPVKQ